MALDRWVELTLAGTGLVVGAGWTYAVWCIEQLTDVYRARAHLASEEAETLRRRIEVNDVYVRFWDATLERMNRRVEELSRELQTVVQERDALADRLVGVVTDPLGPLLPRRRDEADQD